LLHIRAVVFSNVGPMTCYTDWPMMLHCATTHLEYSTTNSKFTVIIEFRDLSTHSDSYPSVTIN